MGKQELDTDLSSAELKHQRQQRDQLLSLGMLLVGQSYWREARWEEAQVYYRKLAQIPGNETLAKSYLNLLDLLQISH